MVKQALGDDLLHVPSEGASASLNDLMRLYSELPELAPSRKPAARLLKIKKAIENNDTSVEFEVADFIDDLTFSLRKLRPNYQGTDQHDEVFLAAVEASTGIISDFAALADMLIINNHTKGMATLYDGFGKIYKLRDGLNTYEEDYVEFILYELFLIFVFKMIRYRAWEALNGLLESHIYVKDKGYITFHDFSSYIEVLDEFRKRRLSLNRLSVQHDIIAQRYGEGGNLHHVVSNEDLQDADFFLILRTGFKYETLDAALNTWGLWIPRAMVSRSDFPEFIQRCVSQKYAEDVCLALGIDNYNTLKTRLPLFSSANRIIYRGGFVRYPGEHSRELINNIGTRP